MARPSRFLSPEAAAEDNRRRTAERNRCNSAAAREIGPLPAVADPARKEACCEDLLRFMQTYGASIFVYPFCREQLLMIQTVQDVLLHGGQVPLCIFRGGSKTTICEWGLLWAACYGHQAFSVIVSASASAACRILSNIKALIEEKDTLFSQDFPEVYEPIARLGRVWQRVNTQTFNGERTAVTYSADLIQFPRIPGALSSGSIIKGVGLDSSFRGLRIESQRPTAVILDDPQTDKSAKSPKQTENRWETLTGSIKGLAGPGVSLALIAAVTVIRPHDLAERILERWGGQRLPLMRSMPSNMEAWELYHAEQERLRHNGFTPKEALDGENGYYIEHRSELDAGAEPAWEYAKAGTEVSAVQHAMNLYFFDKKAFWSEYQNQPMEDALKQSRLKLEDLNVKILPKSPACVVPLDYDTLTAGIDIQKDCLYWLITAWNSIGSGHVVDYGRYPKGRTTLQKLNPSQGLEQQIAIGLTELTAQIAASSYKKEDGETLSVCHTLIDANWGLTTSVVKRVCKNCGTRFEPTLGWGMGPDREFFRTLRKPGELRGEGWRKPPLKECDLVRHYIYNTNLWKSKLRDRLLTSAGGAGSITFYHGDHTKLFQHLLSETSSPLTGIHGTMDKWSLIPGEPNHWWDCLTMSLVAYTTLSSSLHYNARLNIPSNAAGPAANTPIFCDLSSYCKR